MSSLEDIRNEIDSIDSEIAELFEKRMNAVKAVSEEKGLSGLPVKDQKREDEVINKHINSLPEELQPFYRQFMDNVFNVSRNYQKSLTGNYDELINNNSDGSTFIVKAFSATQAAKKSLQSDPATVNGTVGSYYREDGTLLAFNTVYEAFDRVPDNRKAGYASRIEGNDNFNEAVFNWINRLDNIHIPHKSVASAGGTGAISMPIANCVNRGESLLIPEIAWGSYKTIAAQFGAKLEHYKLLDNDDVSLDDLKKKSIEIMNREHKLVVVINDPCQNPTGISYTYSQWEEIIAFYNSLAEKGPVMIINDIAYFDFCNDYEHSTNYMGTFNDINDNVTIVIAFSCSKSLTAYGMRLGDSIILCKNEKRLDMLFNAFVRSARSWWSNANNGLMDTFVEVMNHQEEYIAEKDEAIKLLNKRAELFLKQAKECGLPVYPYKEGFFVTVKVEDNETLNKYDEELHKIDIFGVPFNKGLRIAICGIPLQKIDGLAYKLKEVLDDVSK